MQIGYAQKRAALGDGIDGCYRKPPHRRELVLGREVGDEVEVETPSGVTKLTIASIR